MSQTHKERTGNSNYVSTLEERAREVVDAWEMLPDLLPDIDGLHELSQAVLHLRALIVSSDA